MGSWYEGEWLNPKVDTGLERSRCLNNVLHRNNEGENDDLYTELWHACAGSLVNVPHTGDKVFYFPQGHMEQVEAYMNKEDKAEMPIYNLPSKILCKVVHVQLKAEVFTDEVFAQITLLPEVKSFGSSPQERPSPEDGTSHYRSLQKNDTCSFSKRLTQSDTSVHGGFFVPRRHADECFPSLDMSQQPPAKELVAKDLHGFEWRFRHIYRGKPKRHLLTSGWSTFVSAKKLVAGDACIFLRGKNGELYVGFRRATKPQNNTSPSVISGCSMQHGILASAFHAISTGTMFTVYYRPWTSPAAFIIHYDLYMKSAENDYSVGMRFRMQFEGEEEQRSLRLAGTIVGIENMDCIRWPSSEWRCLKVQWDAPSGTLVRPERVSPWSIEAIVVTKNNTSILPHQKRPRPLDASVPAFPDLIRDVGDTPERHSRVFQGKKFGATGASMQPPFLHLVPQPNPDWGNVQIGLENNPMHDPFYKRNGSTVSVPGGNSPESGLTSHGAYDGVEESRNSPVANFNSASSESQDWKVPDEKSEIEASLTQPHGSGRYMLFGVDIVISHLELPSPQVTSSTEHRSLFSVPPAVSQLSISEPKVPEKQCKNCHAISNLSCTKVLKYGTSLGRSVDLTRFDGYSDLIGELDQMFDFKGALIAGNNGWRIIYTDGEGDILLIGEYPWPKFRAMVRKLFICPEEDIRGFEAHQTQLHNNFCL